MVAALGGSVEGGAARTGAYRRETLEARFGDMVPDVLIALTACERREAATPANLAGLFTRGGLSRSPAQRSVALSGPSSIARSAERETCRRPSDSPHGRSSPFAHMAAAKMAATILSVSISVCPCILAIRWTRRPAEWLTI